MCDELLDVCAALLRERQGARRLQDGVEALEHGVLCERHLVQDQDVAALHRRHERTIGPREERLVLAHLPRHHALQRQRRRLHCRGGPCAHRSEGGVRVCDERAHVECAERARRVCGAGARTEQLHRAQQRLAHTLLVTRRSQRAEQIARLRVLMTVEHVRALMAQRCERERDARLAHARVADEQRGLAVSHSALHQDEHPLRRVRPHEALALALALAVLQHALRLARVERVHVERDLELLLEHALHGHALLAVPQPLREQHVALTRHERRTRRHARPRHALRPAKEVAQSDGAVLAREERRLCARALQVAHHGHERGRETRRQGGALAEDLLELGAAELLKVQLHEAVAKGARQGLAPAVEAARVLCGEEHEVRVRREALLRLGHVEFAIVVEQPIERLEHVARREVELVQDEPVARAHRRHERALVEAQRARRRVRHVLAEVLLQIRVLVVVDAHALVPRQPRQMLHHARLARGGRALQQHGVARRRHETREGAQLSRHSARQDELGVAARRLGTTREPHALHTHHLVRHAATAARQGQGRERDVCARERGRGHELVNELCHVQVTRRVELRQEGECGALVQGACEAPVRRCSARHCQGARQGAQRVARPLTVAVAECTRARVLARARVERHERALLRRTELRHVGAHEGEQIVLRLDLVHEELREVTAH